MSFLPAGSVVGAGREVPISDEAAHRDIRLFWPVDGLGAPARSLRDEVLAARPAG